MILTEKRLGNVHLLGWGFALAPIINTRDLTGKNIEVREDSYVLHHNTIRKYNCQ